MIIENGKEYKCSTCNYWDKEHAPCAYCMESTWQNGKLVTSLAKWKPASDNI